MKKVCIISAVILFVLLGCAYEQVKVDKAEDLVNNSNPVDVRDKQEIEEKSDDSSNVDQVGPILTRSIPNIVKPNQKFVVTYTASSVSGSWGASVEESVSGGCTFPSGSSTYKTVMLSEDGLTRTIQINAPSSGSCTFTGNYKFGSDSIINFPSQTVTVTSGGGASLTRTVPASVNPSATFSVTYATNGVPNSNWFVQWDDTVSGGCTPTNYKDFTSGTTSNNQQKTTSFTAPSSGSCTFGGLYKFTDGSQTNFPSQTVTVGSASGVSMARDIPISVVPNSEFIVSYRIINVNGNYGVTISDVVSGGCTPSTLNTGFLSPVTSIPITFTAPASGSCTFTGDYQVSTASGTEAVANFPSQTVTISSTSGANLTRTVPASIAPGATFVVTYDISNTDSSNYAVFIEDDVVSGGCTPSNINKVVFSPDTSVSVTMTAPASGSCIFGGNYLFAGQANNDFPLQTVVIS